MAFQGLLTAPGGERIQHTKSARAGLAGPGGCLGTTPGGTGKLTRWHAQRALLCCVCAPKRQSCIFFPLAAAACSFVSGARGFLFRGARVRQRAAPNTRTMGMPAQQKRTLTTLTLNLGKRQGPLRFPFSSSRVTGRFKHQQPGTPQAQPGRPGHFSCVVCIHPLRPPGAVSRP